ncbi:MAG: hypothetical protein GEU79_13195, partial [Acidimicrobiia bacterium]|nr:hypothetical protein [Acidimicrobiia bacterium]
MRTTLNLNEELIQEASRLT